MADSYRNDLYFNIGKAGEHGSTYEMSETDPMSWRSGYNLSTPENYTQNQKFIYPDRLIRSFNGKRDGSFADRVTPSLMKRGYIRNLSDMVVPSGARPVRCQFQFNPSRLDHSVQQNTTIRNFLLQTPSDMAQPVPGNTSFRFELFFDRTMEFNNSVTGSDFDPENAWANSSPHYVGVLHDLGILYSCIGVGQSKEGKDYALELYQQQLYNEQNTTDRLWEEQYGGQDSDTEDSSAVAPATVEPNALSDFLDVNVGNSAFLLPYPVRAVFSSLYVVEGFVGSVAVTFNKFSQSMVPLQCVVVLEMEAKYIGFAKEKTFFSEMLTKQRETAIEEATRQASIQTLIRGIVDDDFTQMNFAIKPAVSLGFDDSNALDADRYDVSGFGLPVEDIRNYSYDFDLDGNWKEYQSPRDKLFLTVNFPFATNNTSGFWKRLSPVGQEFHGDAGRLWEGAEFDLDGEKNFKLEEASIEIKGRLQMWAYNDVMAAHIDEHMIAPSIEKKQEKVVDYVTSPEIITGARVIPVMDVDLNGAENAIATTRGEWEEMVDPDDGKIWGLDHRVTSAWADFIADEEKNGNALNNPDANTRGTSWYYVFSFDGSVIIKASGATVATGASYYWASQYAPSGGNTGGGQGLDYITGRIEGTLTLDFPDYGPPEVEQDTVHGPWDRGFSLDNSNFPRPVVSGTDTTLPIM